MKKKKENSMDKVEHDIVSHQQFLAKESGYDLQAFEESNVTSPNHYTKMKVQPIEFLMTNDLPYWASNVIKYAARAGAGGKLVEGKSSLESELDDINKILEYSQFRKRQLLGEPITGGPNEGTKKRGRKSTR